MKLIGVARISDKQKEAHDLDAQCLEIRKIAASQSAELIDIVKIVDVTGSNVTETPEWRDRILPAISTPDTHLAIYSLDRLIRASDFASFQILQMVHATGTRIYTPHGVANLDNINDFMLTGVQALMAGYEKAQIRRRTNAGKEVARRLGRWVSGRLSLAIAYDKKSAAWSYTSDEDKATVCSIFHRFVVDREPIDAIAKDHGINRTTARNILKHPIYKGMLVFDMKRGEAYATKDGKQPNRKKAPRAHEDVIQHRVFGGVWQLAQLITDEQWESAQVALRGSTKRVAESKATTAGMGWLSGFVRPADAPDVQGTPIGQTGISLLSMGTTRHVAYSVCNRNNEGGRVMRYSCICNNPRYKEKTVAKCHMGNPAVERWNLAVDKYIVDLTKNGAKFVKDVMASFADAETQKQRDADTRVEIQKSLDHCDKMMQRAVSAFLDMEIIDKAAFDTRKAEIDRKRAAAQDRLGQLAQLVPAPTLQHVQSIALDRKWKWRADWSPEQKREWLKTYCEAIYISDRGIESIALRIQSSADGTLTFAGGDFKAWSWLLDGAMQYIPASSGLLLSDAAKRLGVPATTLKAMFRAGKLTEPSKRVKTNMRFWDEADFPALEAEFITVRAMGTQQA